MKPNRTELSNKLQEMNEYEFEELVSDVWSERGWDTRVTTGSNDRGIDVIAEKHSPFQQKQLIQAKRYSSNNKIGSPDIQQYSSLYHQEDNVDSVIIVTTSAFSDQGKKAANKLNIKLVNNNKLIDMIFNLDVCESILSNYGMLGASKSKNNKPTEKKSKEKNYSVSDANPDKYTYTDASKSSAPENKSDAEYSFDPDKNYSVKDANTPKSSNLPEEFSLYSIDSRKTTPNVENIAESRRSVIDTEQIQNYEQGGTTFNQVDKYLDNNELIVLIFTAETRKIAIGSKEEYEDTASRAGNMSNLQPTYIFTNKNIISIIPNIKDECDEVKKIDYKEISNIEIHHPDHSSIQRIKVNADKTYHIWLSDESNDDLKFAKKTVANIRAGYTPFE